MYLVFFGRDIKDGYVVDHLCCNKSCCYPRHLQPVTKAENNRRAHRDKQPKATLPIDF
ncbi:HNH endonuclease [Candidatus Saccharibacteria bacterium]|nr:HNH endonuclease [Candidatus Saccharibacteria bacterium]